MKVKKIDRRMKGFGNFVRIVDFYEFQFQHFLDLRNWCWEQWGPSCEFKYWKKQNEAERNPAWCWDVDEWKNRIYFANESEVQWFYLRWIK